MVYVFFSVLKCYFRGVFIRDPLSALFQVPLMALGSLTKYYIPPVMDPAKTSFKYLNHNQVLFEQAMADTLAVKPGQVAPTYQRQ